MDTRNFTLRHVGISEEDLPEMLRTIGVDSLDNLLKEVYPDNIFLKKEIELPEPMTERELAEHITELASRNTPTQVTSVEGGTIALRLP